MGHRTRSGRWFGALAALAAVGIILMTGSPAAAVPAAEPAAVIGGQWTIDGKAISGSELNLILPDDDGQNDVIEPCEIDNEENCPINRQRPQPLPTTSPMPDMTPMDPQPNIPPIEVTCRNFDPMYQIFRDLPPGAADIILLRWQFHFRWCFNNARPVGERIAFYATSAENPRSLSRDARIVRFGFPPVITSNDAPLQFPPFLGIDTRRAKYDGAQFAVETLQQIIDSQGKISFTSSTFFFEPLINVVVASDGDTYTLDSILP